jgi:hypothetical protein
MPIERGMKTILFAISLTLNATSARAQTTASDCAGRLLTQFSTSVIDLKHRAESATNKTSDTLEFFVSTPLRFQTRMQQDSAHFRRSFRDCPKSIVEAANVVADTFDVFAKGYASVVQTGKKAWLLTSNGKNAGSQPEVNGVTEELEALRTAMAEQTDDIERRKSRLPQIALLVFEGVIGKSPAKNKVALLLSGTEKQRVISEITKLCAGQCVVKAGIEYPYAAVGLILEKLREPFLLNGTPREK